jgi:hypothetical protein
MESHNNVLAGYIFAAEEITFVAIERADLSVVEFHSVAIGPVDRPQTCLGIEQSQGEAFERLAVQLRVKNVEIALTQQDGPARHSWVASNSSHATLPVSGFFKTRFLMLQAPAR